MAMKQAIAAQLIGAVFATCLPPALPPRLAVLRSVVQRQAGTYTAAMDANTTREFLAAVLAVPVAKGLWWLSDLLARGHAERERRRREEARDRLYRRWVEIGRRLRNRLHRR